MIKVKTRPINYWLYWLDKYWTKNEDAMIESAFIKDDYPANPAIIIYKMASYPSYWQIYNNKTLDYFLAF